jgi:hypothetical protein
MTGLAFFRLGQSLQCQAYGEDIKGAWKCLSPKETPAPLSNERLESTPTVPQKINQNFHMTHPATAPLK